MYMLQKPAGLDSIYSCGQRAHRSHEQRYNGVIRRFLLFQFAVPVFIPNLLPSLALSQQFLRTASPPSLIDHVAQHEYPLKQTQAEQKRPHLWRLRTHNLAEAPGQTSHKLRMSLP